MLGGDIGKGRNDHMRCGKRSVHVQHKDSMLADSPPVEEIIRAIALGLRGNSGCLILAMVSANTHIDIPRRAELSLRACR